MNKNSNKSAKKDESGIDSESNEIEKVETDVNTYESDSTPPLPDDSLVTPIDDESVNHDESVAPLKKHKWLSKRSKIILCILTVAVAILAVVCSFQHTGWGFCPTGVKPVVISKSDKGVYQLAFGVNMTDSALKSIIGKPVEFDCYTSNAYDADTPNIRFVTDVPDTTSILAASTAHAGALGTIPVQYKDSKEQISDVMPVHIKGVLSKCPTLLALQCTPAVMVKDAEVTSIDENNMTDRQRSVYLLNNDNFIYGSPYQALNLAYNDLYASMSIDVEAYNEAAQEIRKSDAKVDTSSYTSSAYVAALRSSKEVQAKRETSLFEQKRSALSPINLTKLDKAINVLSKADCLAVPQGVAKEMKSYAVEYNQAISDKVVSKWTQKDFQDVRQKLMKLSGKLESWYTTLGYSGYKYDGALIDSDSKTTQAAVARNSSTVDSTVSGVASAKKG